MAKRDKPGWWHHVPLVVVDTETTGLHRWYDRIVEVGIVVAMGGEVIETWGTLIDPECRIPEAATEVHHITDEMVAEAPRFEEVGHIIRRYCAQGVTVGFNALGFDGPMLGLAMARAGLPADDMLSNRWIDPMVACKAIKNHGRYERGYKLEQLVDKMGLQWEGEQHRAVGDCLMTLRVLEQVCPWMPGTLPEVFEWQQRWVDQQNWEYGLQQLDRGTKFGPYWKGTNPGDPGRPDSPQVEEPEPEPEMQRGAAPLTQPRHDPTTGEILDGSVAVGDDDWPQAPPGPPDRRQGAIPFD